MPLTERLFPRRYVVKPDASIMQTLNVSPDQLESMGLDAAALESFLAQPGAGMWQGRALYPRFYDIGKGETASDFPYNIQPYPRLAFTLIGPQGQSGVVLPGRVQTGRRILSGVDVLVLGCYTPLQTGGLTTMQIDALAVLPFDRAESATLRDPLPPLECPLRAPVCVDQATCR